MFKHKAQTKPSSNLKGSARKALLTSICSNYGLDENTLTPEVKQSLLPKDIRHSRAITHTDRYKLLIYSDENGRPLWFKFESGFLDKLIFPTVLTLWKNPYLANDKSLNTPLNVLPVIQGGADLMIPGCFPPYPDLVKGQPVIYLSYPEKIPLGVGVVLVNQTCNLTRDIKGKAAQTIHTLDDTLVSQFKNETVITPGLEFDYNIPSITDQPEPVSNLATGIENLATEEVKSEATVPPEQSDSENPSGEKVSEEEDESFTPQEADDFFMNALLLTIYQFRNPEARITTNPNLTTDLELPISASQMLDSFVVPNLAIPVSAAPNLTIKATSYKKANKFLKAMEKQELITTKEMRDGMYVTEVAEILKCPILQDFQPYTIRKKKKPDSAADPSSVSSTKSKKDGNQMVALSLWKPHSSSNTFFNTVAKENKDIFTVQSYYDTDELKARIVTYINSHKLVNSKDKREVVVDEILIQAFGLSKRQSNGPYVPGNSTIPRDKAVSYLQSQCTSFHLLYSPDDLILQQFNEYTAANKGVVPTPLLLRVLKPAKGQVPQVHVKTERRGGNKTVTTVSGLEAFGIVPAAFAEELRKACAGSTSVNPLKPGGKGSKGKGAPPPAPKEEPKDDGPKQVLVQGPQVKAVETLLLKKGLRPAWIDSNDKEQKKKGGRK